MRKDYQLRKNYCFFSFLWQTNFIKKCLLPLWNRFVCLVKCPLEIRSNRCCVFYKQVFNAKPYSY